MATPQTAIATVDRDATAKQLVKLIEEYGPTAIAKLDHFSRAFRLADAVQKFRFVVRNAMPLIKPLQGSALGFLTDKDRDGGYSDKVIEEAATEALMRGLTLDGNQWNIISGRCYVTKNGMAVIVSRLPGLTDLRLNPGIPQFAGIGAVLDFSATWNLDGKLQSLTRKIIVKCRPGEVDAALGKATRKMLAAIYEMVTGSDVSEEGEEVVPPRTLKSQSDIEADRKAQNEAAALGEIEKALAGAKDEVEIRAFWGGERFKKHLWPILDDDQHNAVIDLKDRRKAELAMKQDAGPPDEARDANTEDTPLESDGPPPDQESTPPAATGSASPALAGPNIVEQIDKLCVELGGSWEKFRAERHADLGITCTRAKDLTPELALKIHAELKGLIEAKKAVAQ